MLQDRHDEARHQNAAVRNLRRAWAQARDDEVRPMRLMRLARPVRKAGKRFREARMLVRALRSPYRPVAAHLIPIRRCNLSCTYCNEFDDHSRPVPTADVFRRIDRLAMLGTGIITLSGGEPLLHPDLDGIIRRIRSHHIIATLITNGYLLSRDRIQRDRK